MLLHEPTYLLFLLLTVLAYQRARIENREWRIVGGLWARLQVNRGLTPAWDTAWLRKLILVAASYFFYCLFDLRFALVLLALTLAGYGLGRKIAQPAPPPTRPSRLSQPIFLGIALNLGALAFFKYMHFFLPAGTLTAWNLVLPVGISFYTFQGISYLTEIHRKKLQPAASLLDYALYLAFFPKLVAGPLVRPAAFLPSLSGQGLPAGRGPASPLSSRLTQQEALLAGKQILWGLFKKIVIADALTLAFDVAWRGTAWPAGELAAPLFWQGFYLYAFHIYADFSGYTDIALGSARLFGFTLPENFRTPYFAVTLADFWNRWHMSLTQWFREYLFFPLSRALLVKTNRQHAQAIQALANLVTMFFIGMWHGASLTFVAWGLWHGLLLTLEKRVECREKTRLGIVLRGLLTFHLVGLGWVLFAAPSFKDAWAYVLGMFSGQGWGWTPEFLLPVLLSAALLFGMDLLRAPSGNAPPSGKVKVGLALHPERPAAHPGLRQFLESTAMIAAIFVIVALSYLAWLRGDPTQPFIYGQF